MKRLIGSVLACVCGVAMAAEAPQAALPPQEEVPFKIVIEDVPETAPGAEDAQEKKAQPVSGDEPVAEEAEETPQDEPQLNCGHVLSPPKGFDQEVLMLQIFLDRNNFSCGVIEGVWGEGSRLAMRAWQKANGLRRTQWVDVPLYGKLAEMEEPLVRVTISPEDAARVSGPMPPTWAERAKLKQMGYESLGACLAEKYHTSERTLRRLNPGVINWPEDLAPGLTLLVPNVRTAALEQPASLVIALEECVLAGFDRAGQLCLRFPCSIARNKAHLPKVGELTVKNMAPAPNYTYDPRNYGQDPSVGRMVVPAGPRNPVGSRWIGLSLAGYGIHGTPRPNTVGRPESRGCFRLTNWNAEKLFELVRPGTPVVIVKKLADFVPPKSEAETSGSKPAPAAEKPAESEAAAPVADAAAGQPVSAPAAAPEGAAEKTAPAKPEQAPAQAPEEEAAHA